MDWFFIRVSSNIAAIGNTFCQISWALTYGGRRHVGAWQKFPFPWNGPASRC